MHNNLSLTGVSGRNWNHINFDSKAIDKKSWREKYERSGIEFSLKPSSQGLMIITIAKSAFFVFLGSF